MNDLLIIKAGNKLESLTHVTGDYEDWILTGMSIPDSEAQVIDVSEGQLLPDYSQIAAIVITGSAAMVSDDLDWISYSSDYLRGAFEKNIPILGICFGHQLLAQALGGIVSDNPSGIEVGTVKMTLTEEGSEDALFYGLPKNLNVQTSHIQSVEVLPDSATRLATTRLDANHAYAVGAHAWGVQFHPEFSKDVTRSYIRYFESHLEEQGCNSCDILDACRETGHAATILQRFTALMFK